MGGGNEVQDSMYDRHLITQLMRRGCQSVGTATGPLGLQTQGFFPSAQQLPLNLFRPVDEY
jgi:hypothetical protein